ncbi:MAG: glycosyltransferase [Paludibacter sp.]|nr:glycosyltransferase [Paludibacter sp.]
MVKVFQLIRSIHLGGAEIVAFNLAEFCNNKSLPDFEFVVVELHQTVDAYSVEIKKNLKQKKIRIISLGGQSKSVSLLLGPFILAYRILRERPDIIHSHTDLPDLLLSNTRRIFAMLHLKFPKIVRTIHNTMLWPTHDKLGKYTEQRLENDWVVGVSDGALEAYKNLRNKYNLGSSPHQSIIHNGCAIPRKVAHSFNIDDKKINIAFCGRFENQKGIDVLIQRIRLINSKFDNSFVFHLIGSGSYQNEILKISQAYSNVFVYDTVPSVADKLYAFDFLIMPSRFEGLVLISIEASFARVPVIAAFAPGLSETLPVDWPLNFQLDSEESLLHIFSKIKNHEFDLDALKNKAYSYVSKEFSQNAMVDSYSKLYLEINE